VQKQLVFLTLFVLSLLMAGCGVSGVNEFADRPAVSQAGEEGAAEQPAEVADASPTPVPPPTATRFTLTTPTPLPAPPTPTPLPPAATPEPQEEEEETEGEAEAAAAEAEAPALPDNMVKIPAGPFSMGSDQGDPEDGPAQEVDLPEYELDKFEVTNAEYATFADATGYMTYAETEGVGSWRNEWGMGEDSHPVVMVTWDDAAAYCEWLGKRLPTEAEWEKAARGEDSRNFPWGEAWDAEKANVKDRGLRGTAAIGSFGAGASPYGLEDMTGNVWEWTADWYQPYPDNSTEDASYGEKFRVTRGGGWFDLEPQATTFNRNAADPVKTATDEIGFRCAR